MSAPPRDARSTEFGRAVEAARIYLAKAHAALAARVASDGRVDNAQLDRHQFAAHGYAWLASASSPSAKAGIATTA